MGETKFPFTVRSIADYTPTSDSEVPLVTGQIYEVISDDGKGVWWQTTVNGKLGWFPASYTEKIPVNDTPTPPVTSSTTSETDSSSSKAQTSKSSKKSNLKKSKSSGKSKSDKGTKKKRGPPVPSKKYAEKNKKDLPCTLTLQVVEAKELRAVKGDPNKSKTSAHIFVKNLSTEEERRAFSLDVRKKTLSPRWNYLFQILIRDAENEIIIIRLCQGEAFDKKAVICETQILLRSTERNFDAPNYSYEWHPLTVPNATSPSGQIRLYLQYVDTRQTSGPTNFQHISHIGWSKENGFDVENIPPEWKELFKEVGITKGHLRDKEFAETVYNIIQENADLAPPPPPPQPNVNNSSPAPPPPPPLQPSGSGTAPPPPPPPSSKPSSNNLSTTDDDEDTHGDLLASIRKGMVLNKTEGPSTSKPPESSSGGGLEDMLRKAMANHRKVVSDDADEDWSDDDEWDDD